MAVETTNKLTLPWKTRLLTAGIGYVLSWACGADGTLNRRLLELIEINAPPSAVPINGVTSSDITYDPSRHLWFRLYTPVGIADDTKLPVVVYFHGGGFFCGSPKMNIVDAHCRRLAATLDAVVVSVKYRLAPEHRYPAQFEDGFNAVKYLDGDEAAGVLPPCADVSRCFLVGDSCGGSISHQVAVRAAEDVEGFKRVKIAGVVAVQPFLGGEERTESELQIDAGGVNAKRIDTWWKVFLPKGSNKDHEAVNIFGPKSRVDIRSLNFPATMVVIGGFDPLKDWQRRYYDKLNEAGKQVFLLEYPNAIHGFALLPELPESSLFITELKEFIKKQSHFLL